MAITVTEREALAQKLAADGTHAALFTADPGSSGTATGEVTGGTYARVVIVWTNGSTDGTVTGTATLNVPTGTTVTHAAACAGASGAVVASMALPAAQTFATAGTYELTLTFTVNAG